MAGAALRLTCGAVCFQAQLERLQTEIAQTAKRTGIASAAKLATIAPKKEIVSTCSGTLCVCVHFVCVCDTCNGNRSFLFSFHKEHKNKLHCQWSLFLSPSLSICLSLSPSVFLCLPLSCLLLSLSCLSLCLSHSLSLSHSLPHFLTLSFSLSVKFLCPSCPDISVMIDWA